MHLFTHCFLLIWNLLFGATIVNGSNPKTKVNDVENPKGGALLSERIGTAAASATASPIKQINGYIPPPTLSRRPISNSTQLMWDLFKNYSRDVRPVYNDSVPITITMHMWFKQVLKVDEIDQILTIYCWSEQTWIDEYLRWLPHEYGGIREVHPPATKLWRPDILVYNNADMNVNENELSTNIVLKHTGEVNYFRAVITKVTCNLDMTYFPFDKQKCHMQFSSWSYDGGKLQLFSKSEHKSIELYIENLEWKLLDFNVSRRVNKYDCCVDPYVDLMYTFILERNPSYYILNLIIPSVFITVVTMVGFFTPYSSTGENTEKVSLGVTALLSLAIILLMVSDKMPATSKVVPLIGKYYIGLIWLIFSATIITTVTLRLQSKGNSGRPIAPQTRRLFFDYFARFLFMSIDLPKLNPSGEFLPEDNEEKLPLNYSRKRPSNVTIETSTLSGVGGQAQQATVRPHVGANGRVQTGAASEQQDDHEMNELFHSFQSAFVAANDPPPPPAVDVSPPPTRPRRRRHPISAFCSFPQSLCSHCGAVRPLVSSTSDAGISRRLSGATELLVDGSRHHPPATTTTLDTGDEERNVASLLATPLQDVRTTLRQINDRLEEGRRRKMVKREWEQLARVCERFLMVAFIAITVLFAIIMLQAPEVHISAHE